MPPTAKEKKLSNHLNPQEMDVWRSYHKRSCGQYTRCKIDQVNLDIKTTKGHKLGILKLATKAIEQDKHFITESVPNNADRRRVDFINLTEDLEYEIETNKKIKKEGAVTIYVDKE